MIPRFVDEIGVLQGPGGVDALQGLQGTGHLAGVRRTSSMAELHIAVGDLFTVPLVRVHI